MKKDASAREGKYGSLVEFAPVGIFEVKFDPLQIVWANKETCRILGYTKKELLNMNPLDLTDKAGKRLFLERVKMHLAGETFDPSPECKVITKDRTELWIVMHSTLTRTNGVIDGAWVVAQDITKLKNAEQSLRESIKKYQDLVETTNDFVWEMDVQGRYTYCSPQMERLWELKPAEMIGKSAFDVMSPASKEKASVLFAEMVKSSKAFSGLETSGYDSEGRVIFLETDGVPFFDESGGLVGFRGITRDVTECKKSRDALQKEKSMLQEVMNGAENMHLVYLDSDFNFVRVNEAYAKTCGYKPEEMIGKNHFTLYPDQEVEAIFKRVRDTGVPTKFHDRPFVFPDQPERGVTYWDWTLKPVKNEAGEVEGLVFSLVETTERKKAEEALQASEERHRAISDITTDFVFSCVKTPQKKFVINWMAGAAEKVFGYSASEIRNKGCWRFTVQPQDLSIFEEKVTGLKLGQSSVSELRVTHKNGSTRWLEAVARMEQDNRNPKNYRLFGACRDITERKKTEEALLRSEKKYRRLYETSQDGIMARDLQGRMINCNRAYSRMLGYSKKELRTLSVYRLLPEKWRMRRDELYKQIVETGVSKVFEREYIRKDGSVFQASVRSWSLTDDSGKVVGVWSVVRDISELKKTEEELRKAEWVARHRAQELEVIKAKLEDKAAEVEEYATHMEELAEERASQLQDAQRLATIGTTAGMIGHDIRNPLQAIVGDLYLLGSDVGSLPDGEEKESMKESIASIRKSAEYIDKIVQDLQDYAKPLNPVAAETDLEEICEEVLMTNDFVENVDVSFEVQEEGKKLDADADMLKRILSNLVSNAIQAMPQGGKVVIRAFKDAGDVVITVEDSGVGIPEDAKDKLFTPLFTTKSKGQGFGLAVVKRMTEALGGTVTFESEKGKGTKFIVRFPIVGK
jgi:PAS domain S-box-containing protein